MKPLNKMDEQFYVLSDEEIANVEGGGILVGIVIVERSSSEGHLFQVLQTELWEYVLGEEVIRK